MENNMSPVPGAVSGSAKGGMIAISVGLLVVGLVSGYFIGKGRTSPVVYQTATPAATAIPVLSVTPNASATPNMTGWKTYTSIKEPGLSFQYPVDWTLENMYTTGGDVQIRPPKVGTPPWTAINWSTDVTGLGGGCPSEEPKRPNIVLHEVEPIPHATGLYFVSFGIVGDTDASPVGMGIVEGDKSGNPPKLGDTGYCLYYTLFKSRLDSKRDMWLRGTVQFQDRAIAKQILKSLRY